VNRDVCMTTLRIINPSADDYELAEAAMASSTCKAAAMRMLRDECGWTLRQAILVLDLAEAAGAKYGGAS